MNLTLTVMFHGLELDFMQHHDWFVKEVPNSQQLLMLKRPVMFPMNFGLWFTFWLFFKCFSYNFILTLIN